MRLIGRLFSRLVFSYWWTAILCGLLVTCVGLDVRAYLDGPVAWWEGVLFGFSIGFLLSSIVIHPRAIRRHREHLVFMAEMEQRRQERQKELERLLEEIP